MHLSILGRHAGHGVRVRKTQGKINTSEHVAFPLQEDKQPSRWHRRIHFRGQRFERCITRAYFELGSNRAGTPCYKNYQSMSLTLISHFLSSFFFFKLFHVFKKRTQKYATSMSIPRRGNTLKQSYFGGGGLVWSPTSHYCMESLGVMSALVPDS